VVPGTHGDIVAEQCHSCGTVAARDPGASARSGQGWWLERNLAWSAQGRKVGCAVLSAVPHSWRCLDVCAVGAAMVGYGTHAVRASS
jgi:hypothetical protein